MGAYLSSPAVRIYLKGQGGFGGVRFWVGMGLAVVGFVGNVAHDEILLNIRRNTKKDPKRPGEHYAIPHGLLFRYISFPNYFCEWVEWFGFVLASSPISTFSSGSALMESINPPWVFLLSEILLMLRGRGRDIGGIGRGVGRSIRRRGGRWCRFWFRRE